MMRKTLLLLLMLTIVNAKTGIDIGNILKPAFGKNVNVSKKQFKLNPSEMKAVQQDAKAKLHSNIIRMYTVKKNKTILGYGVLIVQRVRTQKAAVLYMIDKSQKIKSIEILAFKEPSEYKPNKAWQGVFKGKSKKDNLFSGKGIPTISGATLSARAISDAARIALSIVKLYK